MVNEEKREFLQNRFIPLVRTIARDSSPRWGKMNPQQMVEHVAGFFRVSVNKLKFPLVTPVEQLPRFHDFLMSEKEFRENTKAPVLPDEPLPARFENMEEAVIDLQKQVVEFFEYFSDDPQLRTLHPVFGELNFEEWVQLHHKHVKHHLKQFGIAI